MSIPGKVSFYNFSSEDFTHSWNGVSFYFLSGSVTELEPYVAEHFAKHLAIRELNRADKPTTSENIAAVARHCAEAPTSEKTESSDIVAETPPKRFCNLCSSRGVRHMKDCPTQKKDVPAVSAEEAKSETPSMV